MWASLPATIDPILLAERGAHLAGQLPLRGMRRLVELCLDDTGEVEVDLRFERPEGERRHRMYGTLSVVLHVACQRCLEPMDLMLRIEPHLLFLRPGDPEEPGRVEDVLVVDRPLSLSAMVEDELLLAMPMIPMHDLSVCPAKDHVAPEGQSGRSGERAGAGGPFSELGGLKRRR